MSQRNFSVSLLTAVTTVMSCPTFWAYWASWELMNPGAPGQGKIRIVSSQTVAVRNAGSEATSVSGAGAMWRNGSFVAR